MTQIRRADQTLNSRRPTLRSTRRHQQARTVVLHRIAQTVSIRSKHRRAARLRLQRHQTERFRRRRGRHNNGGTEKLRSNIEDMLGVPVDFYVSVDLKGFIALIDQIGGVDFDVPEDMDYDDPYQDLHIHFKKGLQHLSGQQSMEVVRFRHNSDKDKPAYGGRQDIGRIGTQQAFLKTVAQKLMKLENVPAMAETFLKYVKTDLTLGNLVWLANQALSMGGTDAISFATLPGDGAGWYNGKSFYTLYPEQVLEMTNSMLNPYVADITADEQNILVP